MSKQLLRDVDIFPTSEVIHEALGEASASYEMFLYRLSESFPEMSLDWRYYKDGKAWQRQQTEKDYILAFCLGRLFQDFFLFH